jgi:hypothetical protein
MDEHEVLKGLQVIRSEGRYRFGCRLKVGRGPTFRLDDFGLLTYVEFGKEGDGIYFFDDDIEMFMREMAFIILVRLIVDRKASTYTNDVVAVMGVSMFAVLVSSN